MYENSNLSRSEYLILNVSKLKMVVPSIDVLTFVYIIQWSICIKYEIKVIS